MQAFDLLDASVGRCTRWEEALKAGPGNTGGIRDPISCCSASVIPEEICSGFRW